MSATKRTPGPVFLKDGVIGKEWDGQFANLANTVRPRWHAANHVKAAEEAEANGEFIVEAWNNYERVKAERDELLAALKAVRKEVYTLTDALHVYHQVTDAIHLVEPVFPKAIESAKSGERV